MAITLSHRGIVRMAFRRVAASQTAATGTDFGDEVRSGIEDADWLGEIVMAEKIGGRRRTLPDESPAQVAPSRRRPADLDDSAHPRTPHEAVDVGRPTNRSTASRSAVHAREHFQLIPREIRVLRDLSLTRFPCSAVDRLPTCQPRH